MQGGWQGFIQLGSPLPKNRLRKTIRLGARSHTSGCQPRGRDRNQFSEVPRDMAYFCHVISATELISASPKVRDEGSMRWWQGST